jgi:hypothetical protein
MMSRTRAFVAELILRRPARKRSIAQHLAALTEAGDKLQARTARAAATDANRAALRHIIGIERWGQRRLGTILGQSAIDDEYDAYQPADTLDWPALRDLMSATRQETIALGRQIEAREVGDTVTARHNDIGDLTTREWLRYLAIHAYTESFRLR